MKNYLNFETDIKNLESELEQLKDPYNQEGLSEVNTDRISELQTSIDSKLKEIYSNLDQWQTTLVARHENRPKAKYFIENIFTDFIPLSGDRYYAEDKSVIAGLGKFESKSVLIVGQEKGEDLNTRIERNFGMMRPEGYRKVIRLMKLADKFNIPVISFIDTPGAYPGVGAEERGQAEAIAKSIECCMELKVPTISIIIGEGGSGGAIALASSNKVLMLENAIYSVISPKAMKLSSKDLLNLEIIDEIIGEPTGGAHRDKDLILNNVRDSLKKNLKIFDNMSGEEIFTHRKNKFLSIGRNKGFTSKKNTTEDLSLKQNIYEKLKVEFTKNKKTFLFFISAIIIISILSLL